MAVNFCDINSAKISNNPGGGGTLILLADSTVISFDQGQFPNPHRIIFNASGAPFAGVAAGDRIKVTGAANAANNGTLTATGATATTISFAGTPFVSEGAGASVTITRVAQ